MLIGLGRRRHALALLQIVERRHQNLPAAAPAFDPRQHACRPAKPPPAPPSARDSAPPGFHQCARGRGSAAGERLRLNPHSGEDNRDDDQNHEVRPPSDRRRETCEPSTTNIRKCYQPKSAQVADKCRLRFLRLPSHPVQQPRPGPVVGPLTSVARADCPSETRPACRDRPPPVV